MTAFRYSTVLLLGLLLSNGSRFVLAAEDPAQACFKAKLIWGTDSENKRDPKLKPVDAKLVAGFKKIFKWKHYYRVNEEEFCVPAGRSKKIHLSEKCEIQVRDLGKPMVEVKLFGEGTLVKSITHAAVNCLVLAGDDKNDTAWFVVLIPK